MSLDRDIASGLAERNDAGAALHGSRPTCRSDPNARGRPRAAPLDTSRRTRWALLGQPLTDSGHQCPQKPRGSDQSGPAAQKIQVKRPFTALSVRLLASWPE